MRAYKFLSSGAVGLYSGFRWPQPAGEAPGEWVEAVGPLEPCHSGIHACGAGELAYWLDDELWEIELEGTVAAGHGVVARRARLVRLLEGWDAETASAFALACAERARELAEQALEQDGHPVPIPRTRDSSALRDVLERLAAAEDDPAAARLLSYTRDAAEYASNATTGDAAWASCTAFLEAFLAGLAESRDPGTARRSAAFAERRRLQSDWLARRLELDGVAHA